MIRRNAEQSCITSATPTLFALNWTEHGTRELAEKLARMLLVLRRQHEHLDASNSGA
jgi:hypothetical protein